MATSKMNAEQYAQYRGVTKMTVSRWCQWGKIPAVKVGREWEIDPVAADAMLLETQDTRQPTRASARPVPVPTAVDKPKAPPKPVKAAKAPNAESAQKPSKPPKPPRLEPPPPKVQQPGANGPTLAEAQRAKAVYQAERERLALMREKEELVLASEVQNAYFAKAREIRDALLNLATRLAPILATVSDAAECHRLLTEEHAIALRSLADG